MQGRVKIALGLGTALVAAAALASCSKSGEKAASFNEAPSSTAYVIRPGQYETTIRITNFTGQNLPADMQQGIDRARQNPQTQRSCIPIGFSLDSASLKNLRFTFPGDMGGCNIGESVLDGGSYRAAISCDVRGLPQGRNNGPQALAISANINGTYSGDSSNGTIHAEVTEPGGNRSGAIDVEISSRRVGDCPAGTNPFGPSTMPPTTTPMPAPPPPMMDNRMDANASDDDDDSNTSGNVAK